MHRWRCTSLRAWRFQQSQPVTKVNFALRTAMARRDGQDRTGQKKARTGQLFPKKQGQDGRQPSCRKQGFEPKTYGLKWHDSTTEPGSHLRKLPVIDRKVDFCVFKHQRARLRAEMKNGSGNSSGAPPRGPSGARSQSAPTAGAQFAPTATPATTTPPSSLRHPPSRVDAPIVFWISQLFCSGPPCRK